MEALSLTGFRTRSIISLITVIVVLLLTFVIQQKQLHQQQHNLLLLAMSSELSERSLTMIQQRDRFQKATNPPEKQRHKTALIESLSRISEVIEYLKTAKNLPKLSRQHLRENTALIRTLGLFIEEHQNAISAEQNIHPQIESGTSFESMLKELTDLKKAHSEQVASYTVKQKTTLKQMLILSLSLIIVGILFVVVPVLRRVKSDRAAIERQRLQIARIKHTFDTFTDHSQNGVLNFEKSTGRINFMNQSCLQMLGYQNKQQLVGEPIKKVTSIATETLSRDMAGKAITIEHEEIPVAIDSFESHRIEDGAELIWLNLTDLRPVIEMESRSQNARKMESIGTLASGIAHDFNNILAIIRGSSELLKLSSDLKDDMKKCLSHIIDAGERGAAMVRQILQFSRSDSDFLKVVDIVESIEQTIDILTTGLKKKCAVNFKYSASGNVLADESSISQILINLVKNASQAGASEVNINLARKNEEFILEVADNGSGISDKVIKNIFDPFFSTKQKTESTGLGLSVVHGIVEKLKGDVQVSSELSKGTTFTIKLPVSNLEIETPAVESTPEEQTNSQHVLLVEDEDNLRHIYATYLSMKGFKVTEASNGEEAVALYQQNHNSFDILLTDHNMPGLLGTEVILAIRHLSNKALQTIMVTGDIEDAARELKSQGLIDEILTKPIALTALDSAINQLKNKKVHR